MRTQLYVSLVPFLIFSALQAPMQMGGVSLPNELRSTGATAADVTDLALEQGATYDLSLLMAVADRFPKLKRLTLTGPADLPTDTSAETNDQWSLRVETAHGIFLGDAGMTMAQLLRYASFLERTAVAELERDTGLRPQTVKPVFQLYGDEAHWHLVAGSGTFWGYYAAPG
ncbi:MAG: hypothetical protein K0R39_1650 [Symbiobacteriaceae bacterium]|nr:hypothetical protein [Symbiobacteriaceae bacterium]